MTGDDEEEESATREEGRWGMQGGELEQEEAGGVKSGNPGAVEYFYSALECHHSALRVLFRLLSGHEEGRGGGKRMGDDEGAKDEAEEEEAGEEERHPGGGMSRISTAPLNMSTRRCHSLQVNPARGQG